MEEIDFLEAAIICKNCDLNYEQLPGMTIRNKLQQLRKCRLRITIPAS
jgi:hypothetical protein